MAEADLEYAWFFRVEFPMVLRTVFLILGDRGKAEDVTQEAFIQLLSHWKKISAVRATRRLGQAGGDPSRGEDAEARTDARGVGARHI